MYVYVYLNRVRVCMHASKFICVDARVRVRLWEFVYVCMYHMLRVCMCKRV